MAEKIQVSAPAGSAGIFRFYDTEGGGVKIEPSLVIIATVVFILGIMVLRFVR